MRNGGVQPRLTKKDVEDFLFVWMDSYPANRPKDQKISSFKLAHGFYVASYCSIDCVNFAWFAATAGAGT